MTTGSIDRLICVVPPRLTSEAHRGFLDAAQHMLGSAAALRADEVTLDLSRVEKTDAAGLGLLVMTQRRAQTLGVRLVLAGVPPELQQLLAIAGLDRLFHMVGVA